MKLYLTLAASLAFASCAHPLEQIVQENHELRLKEANHNLPVARGASDGLGASIAQSANSGLSVTDPTPTPTPPKTLIK
jgi:hypothetical protein